MTYEDLYFLMAIDCITVSQKADFWVFPRETRPSERFEEDVFKDVDVHLSMYFSQDDITAFSAHVSLSLTSPVNGQYMCYDCLRTSTVSDLLEFSKIDYFKWLAESSVRSKITNIEGDLELQIVAKAETPKE